MSDKLPDYSEANTSLPKLSYLLNEIIGAFANLCESRCTIYRSLAHVQLVECLFLYLCVHTGLYAESPEGIATQANYLSESLLPSWHRDNQRLLFPVIKNCW